MLDMGFNALAGILATCAYASASRSIITHEVLKLGAVTGVIKSGLSNLAVLLSISAVSDEALITIHMAATFTIPFILTCFVAQKTLGSGKLQGKITRPIEIHLAYSTFQCQTR
jgi:hypothetical protein